MALRKGRSNRPSRRDIEIAVAFYEAGGEDANFSEVGRRIRGDEIKYHWVWAKRMWQRPEVQVAYRAIKEHNDQDIRMLAEECGAGVERRIEVLAAQVNGFGGAGPGDARHAIDMIAKREGRAWAKKEQSATATVGVLEAIVLGHRGTGALPDRGRLPDICSAVSLDTDQDTRLAALRVVAASIGPGNQAPAPAGDEPADVGSGPEVPPGRV